VLDQGYEGLVVRIPQGRYKCGRSTIKEGLMIKIKQYADCEAEIVGTEELMHNTNEEDTDNFGNVKRSSSLSGKVKGNTLGAIVAMTPEYDIFKIGTCFTTEERNAIWANRDNITGHFVKYKCAETGSKNLPRNPVFIAIRHKDDIN
jgi:DNA ligase-1